MMNGDGREFVWMVGGSNRYLTRYVSSLNLARRWLAAVVLPPRLLLLSCSEMCGVRVSIR